MTIIAKLADGTELHFPDGTDPSVIQGVVKKAMGGSSLGTLDAARANIFWACPSVIRRIVLSPSTIP